MGTATEEAIRVAEEANLRRLVGEELDPRLAIVGPDNGLAERVTTLLTPDLYPERAAWYDEPPELDRLERTRVRRALEDLVTRETITFREGQWCARVIGTGALKGVRSTEPYSRTQLRAWADSVPPRRAVY